VGFPFRAAGGEGVGGGGRAVARSVRQGRELHGFETDHDWSQTKVSEPVFEKLKKLRKQSIAAQQNIKSPCGRSPAAAWRRSGTAAGGGRIEGGTRGIRFPLPTRTFDV